MIYVNEKQLKQVEYLLEQSVRGHHILFDLDHIRRAFKDARDEEKGDKVEKHIENIILQPTLVSKRAYLENLKPNVYRQVLRTYFSIVENNVMQAHKFSQ